MFETDGNRCLTLREFCELTGLCRRTFYNLDPDKRPPIVRLSERRIGIRRADAMAWLEARTIRAG